MSEAREAFEAGLALRRVMFGPGGADEALAQASDFSRPLQEIVTRFCFGEVWQRPGLERRLRSMLTIAMLIAAGRMAQLPGHVRGALANGVTHEELREVILHALLYCGIPAAVEAAAVCERALAESAAP
ncbi:MAG: carboxymuconolactone decarboxylase family protein [Gammaproteobacteria bacterium]|nr:carboxymuconolactone decarboxylase family protein [Gammaproteobacteria bacterium]